MNNVFNRSKIISSLIWKLTERTGTQGMQFVIQLILARLLLPEDYGIIALIVIFISIATVFVQSGFNTALIQKKNADDTDFSSVLYLSLIVSSLIYTVLFISAPHIAEFYQEPKLIKVIRVLGVVLFFGAINSIQYAIISRTMQFKRLFFSSLGGVVISGVVGIILAYNGFGVWSLVGQQIINEFLIAVILWGTVKWRPQSVFSVTRVKILFSFGWKLLCSALIDTLYTNVYGLVIGKIYNAQMLGYYNRGQQFPNFIVSNINGSIQSVLLPTLSAHQDDKLKVKSMVRRSIITSAFFVFPMMIGLAVCAEPLVKILLTEKWLKAVPFLQILCISYAFWPIHTANLQAINALGRSDLYLKLEIIKKINGVLLLCISIPYGIYVMVAFHPIASLISSFINMYPNKKILNYSISEQWRDLAPSITLSIIMGASIYFIPLLGLGNWMTLILQIFIGTSVYFGLAYILRIETFTYIIDLIETVFKRNPM